MQDEARIKAIYSVLTGQPYAEGNSLLLDIRDLWNSADLLFRFFEPTDAQIGALLLYKFGGASPEKQTVAEAVGRALSLLPDAPLALTASTNGHQDSSRIEREELAQAERATILEVPELVPGAIPWTVEIDGVPVRWRLLYAQSHLPVTKGKLCRFGGNLYRVSKVYGTALHLTSEESEIYSMNGQEVMA